MKKKSVVFGALLTSIFLLSLVSISASEEYVTFSGTFQEGQTLYSDNYLVESGYVWGKDVYPDRSNFGSRIKVCEMVNVNKRVRECYPNTLGYVEVKRLKISRQWNSETKKYETITSSYIYQRPTNAKTICQYVNIAVPTEKCHYEKVGYNPQILCVNPDGTASNVLNLENFKMSINGDSWIDVPYVEQKQSLDNANVVFKVDIPERCSPAYLINNAISIED